MSERTVEINASAFAALVKPVIPLADQGKYLPLLNAVLIEAHGEYLTAAATDRFRMGICRVKTETPPPVGFKALIALAELRHILAIFKPSRHLDSILKLTATDDRLRIEQTGGLYSIDASMTFPLVSGDSPNIAASLVKHRGESKDTPATTYGVNPAFFADFRHAVRDRGEPLVIHATNSKKPIIVTSGDHFIGAIMPVRIAEGPSAESAADEWDQFLKTPAATKTKAA